MSSICGKQFSSDCVPYFGSLIKGSGTNSISEGNIEPHAVDCIFVSLKGVNQVATSCIPKFAGSIIAASDKLVAVFIKAAIGEWQNMSFQLLQERELLVSLLLDLFNQFYA
jgi:hypothetical protein